MSLCQLTVDMERIRRVVHVDSDTKGGKGENAALAHGPVSDLCRSQRASERVAPSVPYVCTMRTYLGWNERPVRQLFLQHRRYRDLSLALAHEHLKRFQQDSTMYSRNLLQILLG